MWQNLKTPTMTKLKNQKCDTTQNVTKLKTKSCRQSECRQVGRIPPEKQNVTKLKM